MEDALLAIVEELQLTSSSDKTVSELLARIESKLRTLAAQRDQRMRRIVGAVAVLLILSMASSTGVTLTNLAVLTLKIPWFWAILGAGLAVVLLLGHVLLHLQKIRPGASLATLSRPKAHWPECQTHECRVSGNMASRPKTPIWEFNLHKAQSSSN